MIILFISHVTKSKAVSEPEKKDYFFFFFYYPASYKEINTYLLRIPGVDEVELTCQAEGYPLAEVYWENVSVPANTSHIKTADGLYQVTSILRLKLHPGRNVSCVFWNANMDERTSAVIEYGESDKSGSPLPNSLGQGLGRKEMAHSE